jgi:hypothetical protein
MAGKDSTRELLASRHRTHGPWPAYAATAQRLKAVVREAGQHLEPSQTEALELIMVKAARILTGDASEPEHWNDIGGYARLGRDGGMK